MSEIKIREDIFYVGANDAERRIFDQLIPLPDGTTYNSYIIRGSEKTVLIDSVDPAKKDVLHDNLSGLNLPGIDYIVSHHGEQDHSGTIPFILSKYPGAKVLTNEKCKSELIDLLHIDGDRFLTVEDGQEIPLGGKTLKIIFTPWVHWPETFVSLLVEDRVLFSCDFFGSHLAFEPEAGLFVKDKNLVFKPAKRYFAEIMSPFRNIIRKNLEKLSLYDFDIIAPSHGPLYRGQDIISFIKNCNLDWASENVKNEVLIAYVSMHGSTEKIVSYFSEILAGRGIAVKSFDLGNADVGDIAMELLDAATAVIGTPTVLAGPHPSAVFAAYLIKALRPKTKFLSIIGSYGWGGKTIDFLGGMLSSLNAEIIDPVLIKGYPVQSDYALLDGLAEKIKDRHIQAGLL